MAAPPATSGVFAFEASSATFPPAFASEPFEDGLCRDCEDEEARRPPACGLLRVLDLEVVRDLEALEEREEPFLDFAAREELLLLLDLFELERLRVDRLLEDRVVWAMVIASLGFLASVPAAPFAPAVHLDLPGEQRI
jgi:hypothetical protein